jgi:integrase/recombinase XerC
MFFRVLRDAGLLVHDPTVDVELPQRSSPSCQPLTDVEVERCRAASRSAITATREPLAWALLETGISTTEAGSVRWRDVDLVRGTLSVEAGAGLARVVPLSAWGHAQLKRANGEGNDWVLVGSAMADGDSRRTRATELVRNVLRRAGIDGKGVSARSLTAWAGCREFAETGSIEAVARLLGFNSLDATAAFIGHDWKSG